MITYYCIVIYSLCAHISKVGKSLPRYPKVISMNPSPQANPLPDPNKQPDVKPLTDAERAAKAQADKAPPPGSSNTKP
jgi:hypothetical protein